MIVVRHAIILAVSGAPSPWARTVTQPPRLGHRPPRNPRRADATALRSSPPLHTPKIPSLAAKAAQDTPQKIRSWGQVHPSKIFASYPREPVTR
jgi:hypothetical protein